MTRIRMLGAAVLASALAACSGGGGVTTASLLGTPAAQPQVDEPTDRALHAASVSARASKCGYNFNPAKLRESFLAAEAASGATPEQMTKLGQSYDFTHTTVSKQISNPEEYCSDQRTRQVSADLTKQLAGDFRSPKKPPLPKSAGWWDTASSQKSLDREEIFNPKHSR
jgi:curli biogenesis system outer membrane secretion channel CsgG